MDNHVRILHEYEITDALGLHFAGIVYLRECTEDNSQANGLCDVVDKVMETYINKCKGCKVLRKLSPRVIALQEEIDEFNKRLLEEYQLKAYFTFYAPCEVKGGVPADFSRITIHTSIFVKDASDVRFFENLGYHENVGDAGLVSQFILTHLSNPVYLLQEHPLVHSIVSFKDAKKSDTVYFLYRHDNNSSESILAELNAATGDIQLNLGTDDAKRDAIERFAISLTGQNNLSPLYNCVYLTDIAPVYVTRLQLNKERDIFSKAKSILDAALEKENSASCKEMKKYLAKMIEA